VSRLDGVRGWTAYPYRMSDNGSHIEAGGRRPRGVRAGGSEQSKETAFDQSSDDQQTGTRASIEPWPPAMSLTEHIDRVARNARSIADVASATAYSAPGACPFTRAMLKTDLGDLIRDIDSAELGLFNLLPPSKPATAITTTAESSEASGPRITRAEFVGATPLRRHSAQKPEARSKESEPEAYAHAALQCIVR
jgi:hypothetical protein